MYSFRIVDCVFGYERGIVQYIFFVERNEVIIKVLEFGVLMDQYLGRGLSEFKNMGEKEEILFFFLYIKECLKYLG